MPRIYSGISDPIDFCRDCFPSYEEAVEQYDHKVCDCSDIEDETPHSHFDYDCAHPPYSETDYECEECGELLTDDDE